MNAEQMYAGVKCELCADEMSAQWQRPTRKRRRRGAHWPAHQLGFLIVIVDGRDRGAGCVCGRVHSRLGGEKDEKRRVNGAYDDAQVKRQRNDGVDEENNLSEAH